MVGEFSCTMDRSGRDGGNKTQRLFRCRPNNSLSKIIVYNGLEDLWRRENPDSSEFKRYDRSSSIRYGIDRVYADIKIANNTKINHITVSFTDYYNAILLTDSLPNLKLEAINSTLNAPALFNY